MCGIAAFFSSQKPVSEETLRKATASLVHRGPDNQKHWVDPDGSAGLAHARLSLLDLSPAGDQPISSSDGQLKLVHNGEFYGFEAIREELETRGHRFATHSDSEILIPLYRELGTSALRRLRGEFAFVLWDRDNRHVFAARDRFGIKPLFYAIHDGNLYFASEVKALFAMGVPAEWDLETAYQYHAMWLLPPHRTLYRRVFQVPPGHFLVASGNDGFLEPRLVPYWDFDYPLATETTSDRTAEEEILALRAKFEESVRLRLRADVPVACYLSGGLDSCSVLGAAAKQSPKPIHAFTISFVDDPAYDEAVIAREMASTSGAVYHEIPVRWTDLADKFDEALWHSEIPFANTHGVAKFILSQAVRDAGFKAVMTGEGSDEIFGGYVHFRKDKLMQQGSADTEARLASLAEANQVSKVFMLADKTLPSLHGLRQTLGYVPSFMEAHAVGAEFTKGLLRPELRQRFGAMDPWRCLLNEFDVNRQLRGRAVVHQSLYLWSRTMLPNYLLTVLGDRMEMGHSIEGRLPFLDHELVEQVVRVRESLKIQEDLTEKYLLREAARPFLTDTVYRRQKHPFLAPPAAAAPTSALFGYVQDVFRSKSFADSPLYDQATVVALLDKVPSLDRETQGRVDGALTAMLSFALLQKRFGLSA